MKTKQLLFAALTGMLIFNACRKDISAPPQISKEYLYEKPTKEQEIILNRFKLATYVFSDMISDLETRKKLNQFIFAKVQKTETDEELTFKEIFSNKKLSLEGVSPDFLIDFKNKFVKTILAKKFRHHEEFKSISLTNENEILKYFGLKNNYSTKLNSKGTSTLTADLSLQELTIDPGFEIYFPYSENYLNQNYQQTQTYAVTYNPLTNLDENEGEIFDYTTGTYKYVSLVDDDFAYGTPTYIITIDDGLTYDDMAYNQAQFVGDAKFKIQLSDDDYNPVTFEGPGINVSNPPSNICSNRELRVKDGRWTLIHNGYGLFEGAIEFAVAFASDVNSVVTPIGTPDSNPLINLKTQAWTYKKLKRSKVKKMINNQYEYVNFAMSVSPWCPGDPDKMLFLYEYDKPNLFSSNSKEFSGAIAGALGLIGSPATKALIAAIPLAPVIKAVLEGSSVSRIEHYSIIGSDEVFQNQMMGTAAFDYPGGLFRGYRPYGNSSVFVTLVVD